MLAFRAEQLESVLRLLHLKRVARKGWTRHPIPTEAVESVADHTYGVALLSLLFCPPELDKERVLELALLHDLAEVETGDITPHDGVPAHLKVKREKQAVGKLTRGLSLAETAPDLQREYQRAATPEARFVKAMDKLDMTLQSLLYEREFDLDLSEFRESAGEALRDLGLDWISRGKNDPV